MKTNRELRKTAYVQQCTLCVEIPITALNVVKEHKQSNEDYERTVENSICAAMHTLC